MIHSKKNTFKSQKILKSAMPCTKIPVASLKFRDKSSLIAKA